MVLLGLQRKGPLYVFQGVLCFAHNGVCHWCFLAPIVSGPERCALQCMNPISGWRYTFSIFNGKIFIYLNFVTKPFWVSGNKYSADWSSLCRMKNLTSLAFRDMWFHCNQGWHIWVWNCSRMKMVILLLQNDYICAPQLLQNAYFPASRAAPEPTLALPARSVARH